MSTQMKRFTVSLPDDLADKLDEIKKERFYNVPHSRMIQQLLWAAISAADSDEADVSR